MSTPVLHVLAGPNGSGKSSFVRDVLQPATGLPFVNADEIAAARWPGGESEHAYEASAAAAALRDELLRGGQSFITETVFSHPSKVDLVEQAVAADYVVALHVMLVPVDVTVRRVEQRVSAGGHFVPPEKIRARFARLWALILRARTTADRTFFYDNSEAVAPFKRVATYERGRLVGRAAWPTWAPSELVDEAGDSSHA